MFRTNVLLLALVAVGGGLPVESRAQAPKPPETEPFPNLPHPPDLPRSLDQPAVPFYECAPLPGPYFEADPLLDPPRLGTPGWFAGVEVGLVVPHVKDRVTGFPSVGGAPPDTVQVPAADLDWVVAPRFEVGYRLPSGFGEIVLGCRFLSSEGTGVFPGLLDGLATVHTRLDFNQVDLDYANRELSLWPHWDMRWRVGARLVTVYFDSEAVEPFDAAAVGGGIFDQRTTNYYWGVGPHAAVELTRRIGAGGLALACKLDGTVAIGPLHQGAFETSTTAGGDGQLLTGASHTSQGAQTVPIIAAQIGLSWQPPGLVGPRVFLGYQCEYLWNVGRMSSIPQSRGELGDQGLVIRAEWAY
jgi:hypothetical protein